MKNAVVAGVAAISIAGGLVVAAVPAVAQDPGAPTTTAPKASDSTRPPKPGQGLAGKHRGRLGAKLDEVASFLGLSAQELKAQLRTTSLGDIAGAKKPELVAMLTQKANERIDAAVTRGKLTKEQADKLKAATAERIAKTVDRVRTPGGGPDGLGRRPR